MLFVQGLRHRAHALSQPTKHPSINTISGIPEGFRIPVLIGDAGLQHLRSFTNLELLWLPDTQVTNAGLRHLSALANLQQLYLANTQVTDAGADARPIVNVIHCSD